MTDVSIVVVTYNAGEWVQKCLRAARELQSSLDVELIVIDNASHEFGEAEVRSWAGPDATVERMSENVGFGRACNHAATLAKGRHILLLNPDAIIAPDAVDALVQTLDERRAGIVGGRVTDPAGELDRGSCWGFQTTWSLVCFASGLSTLLPRSALFNPEGLGSWQRDSERRVDVVTGCLLLADAELWRRLDGFDDDFFMYGEDADLCRRAGELGFEAWITPRARAVHALGASSATNLRKQELLFRGKATLVRKAPLSSRVRSAQLALLQLGVGLRALGERLTGTDRASWLGLWRSRKDWRRGWPDAVSAPTIEKAA